VPFPKAVRRFRSLLILTTLLVLLAVVGATSSPAPAQTSAGAPSEEASASRGPSDGWEVEKFMDGAIGQQLEDREIPGATVSVVKDGKVLLAKGYGRADVEKDEPVSADERRSR
jgi:CubicO group peptidase (beta-lactamase class C family)